MSKLRTDPPIVTLAALATLSPPVTLFTFATQSTLKVDCCLLLRPSRLFRYNSPLLIPPGASLVLRIFCSAPRLLAATSQNPFPATSLPPSLGLLLERLPSTWLPHRPPHAHGVTSTSEASWFGEREGDIGGRGRGKRWHRGGCALRAHGDGLPGEAGESGEREGDVGGIKGWCRVVKGWRAVK